MLTLEVQDGTIYICKDGDIIIEFIPHDLESSKTDALVEVMGMIDARNAQLSNFDIESGQPLEVAETPGKILNFYHSAPIED